MPIKLKDSYIKNKVREKFGELEVYNPIEKNVYNELFKMIQDNSKIIELENKKTDIQIDNTIQIMRYLLINCSNIETVDYWNNIDDIALENILNLANGDFKQVVNSLLDIMIEIGQDIRIQSIRQLSLLNDKIDELTEVFKFNTNMNNKLKEFGLSQELLIGVQNGEKDAIEQFQKKILEQSYKPKSNRGRPKKLNK